MNKTWVIVGVVIVVLAIIGAVVYTKGGSSSTSPTYNNTTTGNTNTGGNNGNGATAKAGVPLVLTGSSSFPTDTTAVVNGTINPEGAITSYWYEYGQSSDNFTDKTSTQVIGSGFNTIPTPGYITGLSKKTDYHFRLVGENQYGKVAGSVQSFKTSEGTPPPVGSAPTVKTLAASKVSGTTANINGSVNPNKAATQYWFEYGQTPKLGSISAFSSTANANNSMTVSVPLGALKSGTVYYFRLNAQNQFGTVNGSILNFKTTGSASLDVSL